MEEAIKNEQKKLADHFKGLNSMEARERQGFALMCYLQGYEAGYQSAIRQKENEQK